MEPFGKEIVVLDLVDSEGAAVSAMVTVRTPVALAPDGAPDRVYIQDGGIEFPIPVKPGGSVQVAALRGRVNGHSGVLVSPLFTPETFEATGTYTVTSAVLLRPGRDGA
jgi:hypothetical protein